MDYKEREIKKKKKKKRGEKIKMAAFRDTNNTFFLPRISFSILSAATKNA